MAVVGFACRLPGGNNSPSKLWDFLERGDVASNQVPKTRFNIKGHYDGSHKPGTMRPKGGMFVGDVDLADFDASFFEIGGTEAIAMDPNQRQMLEVVFEGLENAGIPLEKVDGAPVACFVGSYASGKLNYQLPPVAFKDLTRCLSRLRRHAEQRRRGPTSKLCHWCRPQHHG